jgi:hypothetical protein
MENVERCEAHVAARRVLQTVERASSGWPAELATQAREAARKTVRATAEGAALDASAARRRCVRVALAAAVDLAAACDIARALGHTGADLDDAHRETGRTIALLGLFFHASVPAQRQDQ